MHGLRQRSGNHLVAEGINASGKLLMLVEWNSSSAATGLAEKQPMLPFYVQVG